MLFSCLFSSESPGDVIARKKAASRLTMNVSLPQNVMEHEAAQQALQQSFGLLPMGAGPAVALHQGLPQMPYGMSYMASPDPTFFLLHVQPRLCSCANAQS